MDRRSRWTYPTSIIWILVLILCVLVVVLVLLFDTEVEYNNYSFSSTNKISKEFVIETTQNVKVTVAENKNDSTGKIDSTTGTLINTADEYFKYDQNVYKILKSNFSHIHDDVKLKGLSAIFTHVKQKYGYYTAIGIMACVCHEGNPGIVQYNKYISNWDGKGEQLSTYNHNTTYIRTKENIEAVNSLSKANLLDVGFGMCQWTYTGFISPLCSYYSKYLDGDFLSDDDLRAAEINYLLDTFIPQMKPIGACQGTSPETGMYWWFKVAEMGGSEPVKSGQEYIKRLNSAIALDNVLKGFK